MFLIIDLPPDVLKIDWTDNLRRNLLFWNRFEAQNQSEFTLPPNAVLIMFCCWPFIQTIIHDKIKKFYTKNIQNQLRVRLSQNIPDLRR